MAIDKVTRLAMKIGRTHADEILRFRTAALKTRARALQEHPKALAMHIQAIPREGAPAAKPTLMQTAGILVAEGDSWFDYPFYDVLEKLEDQHGYDVESVAHRGDPIEEMAYGSNQLEEFTRRIEKVLRRGLTPKAVLLSGGGDDVAGDEFAMLLNHARSASPGLNNDVLDGVINQRIRTAYVTILSAVTQVCKEKAGKPLPIVVHGYDYPVPDGRGYMGGWGPLPGPWLEPGFRRKGYADLTRRIALAHDLIDRFNTMLQGVAALFSHVHYINLRNTLPTGRSYKQWWGNELHPTQRGFEEVADRFATVLRALP